LSEDIIEIEETKSTEEVIEIEETKSAERVIEITEKNTSDEDIDINDFSDLDEDSDEDSIREKLKLEIEKEKKIEDNVVFKKFLTRDPLKQKLSSSTILKKEKKIQLFRKEGINIKKRKRRPKKIINIEMIDI
jgi:hypothetical protein